MDVDLIGEDRVGVAVVDTLAQLAEVVDPGEAREARPPVEELVDRIDIHVGAAPQVHDDTGVDISTARTHDETFERCQPHRGVDRDSAFDRRRRRTVAQMQDNLIQILAAQELGGPQRDVLMRGAVEAVPADVVLLRDLAVDGVGRCGRGQRVEERRIEHRDMRHIRQLSAGDLDTEHVRRVVQRCK